jgi:hypothetical protein
VNININEFEPKFLALIKSLLVHEVSIDQFCDDFTDLWIEFRDKTSNEARQTWDERYDIKLIESRLRGEITPDDFSKQFRELCGLTEEISHFCDLVDPIHSMCSAYNPLPKSDWEINEDQLRAEVEASLTNYENS